MTVAYGELEDACDAIAEIALSPEFAATLQAQYVNRAVTIPFRNVEVAYTDEVETPDGYPCLEVVATRTEKERNTLTLEHEISLQWTVNGDDGQRMARELKRLIAATRAHFEGALLQPFVGRAPLTLGPTDFGPIVTGRDTTKAKFVKTAAVTLYFDPVG